MLRWVTMTTLPDVKISRDGKEIRTCSIQAALRLLAGGELRTTDLYQLSGSTLWAPLSGLKEPAIVKVSKGSASGGLFSFKGRIRRTEYWFNWVVCIDALLLLAKLLGAVGGPPSAAVPSSVILSLLSLGVLVLVALIAGSIVWISWASAVKRCHDIGRPGCYALIPFMVFLLIFTNGTPGANVYGSNPKDGRYAARDMSGMPLAIAILIASLGFWLSLMLIPSR